MEVEGEIVVPGGTKQKRTCRGPHPDHVFSENPLRTTYLPPYLLPTTPYDTPSSLPLQGFFRDRSPVGTDTRVQSGRMSLGGEECLVIVLPETPYARGGPSSTGRGSTRVTRHTEGESDKRACGV